MKRDLKLYTDKCTSVIEHNKKVTRESQNRARDTSEDMINLELKIQSQGELIERL